MSYFNYTNAFSRNVGWFSENEQKILEKKRVAIAGLGGVGGSHLVSLSRLGIGSFNISDFDEFEIHNFNRQAGAFLSTIGDKKIDVMSRLSKDINPTTDIKEFPQGVDLSNLDTFLDSVDLYVDSLDFFALDIRRAVFKACYEKNIPAITAAPLGMGAAFLYFEPGGMTFEEYFNFQNSSYEECLVKFIIGLSPSLMQAKYILTDSSVKLADKKGPSTIIACDLCTGVAVGNALKILLERGKVLAAPRGLHFDAYRNKLVKTYRPFGNRNPLQRLLFELVKRRLGI